MDRPDVTALGAKETTRLVTEAAKTSRNEAEFRRQISRVIEDFAKDLDIPILTREEHTLATGRLDAAYNRLIIEYEPPGSLRSNILHKHTSHAVQQVKSYIEGLAAKDRQRIQRLVGIVLDGHYYVFVRHVDGQFLVENPVEVNEYTTRHFLRLLVSLTSGKALLPGNLITDFGSKTLTAERVAKGFYDALSTTLEEEPAGLVAKLFHQWQTFFGEVTGYGAGSTQIKHKKELQDFARGMGVDPKRMSPPLLFFTVHTYFSLLVKLIAYLALSRFVSGFGTRFGALYSLDNDALAKEIGDLERGGLFRRLGIRNFLEGDFFRWYLKTWNGDVADAVRLLVTRLKDYDPGTLEVSPEAARDLLKKLYHYLMPRELRHDLGEFYTPDWLAERLLNQLGYRGDPGKRLLDPACGSGTFLILAINRLKERCLNTEGMNEQETLKTILSNIAGIDLNPLAVIAARTNFLLSIRDLLEHRTDDIDIPVYLADSILAPEVGKTLFSRDRYQIKTTVGPLEIPSALQSRKHIDDLTNLLAECVETNVEREVFLVRAHKKLDIAERRWQGTDGQGEAAREILDRLYGTLTDLHQHGLDGIWAAIVKNYFMPLFIGKFDTIAGNPPWVIWDNLPENYRRATSGIWAKHALFGHKGMDAMLGKAKDDISILMTYQVADALLEKGGRLGFVITQSVFKTSGGGQGFRRFELGSRTPIRAIHVDDMVDFQPFEGASNRTAVMILEKGRRTTFPVAYTIWQKIAKGKSIGFDLSLDKVSDLTRRLHYYAEPVNSDEPTSAWLTARRRLLGTLRKMLGKSDYTARAGIYSGGANGVFWLNVLQRRPNGMALVQNITEKAKREVEQVQAIVEEALLYPLLRSRDLRAYDSKHSAYILVTHLPGQKLAAIPLARMQANYPAAWSYLKHFEKELLERRDRGTRNVIEHGGPFYSMFAVGDYTFAPWKVAWNRIGRRVEADVLGQVENKPILPQETVSLVGLDSEQEALYLAAVLNSLPFNFAAVSYSQAGGKSFGSPHILENIRIPKFDSRRPHHGKLARLAQKARSAAAVGDEEESKRVSAQIDEAVLEIWSLTQADLKEIKSNYAEITKADLETDGDEEPIQEEVAEED